MDMIQFFLPLLPISGSKMIWAKFWKSFMKLLCITILDLLGLSFVGINLQTADTDKSAHANWDITFERKQYNLIGSITRQLDLELDARKVFWGSDPKFDFKYE